MPGVREPEVLVVGGGVAGLALAHALRLAGREPLVLEAAARTGGKLRTDRPADTGGWLCEWGPAALLDRDPVARRTIDELPLGARLLDALPAARRRCVVAGGALAALPDGPIAFARSPILGVLAKLRLLCDLVLPRGPSARGQDESVAAFASRRLGAEAAARLFYPLVSGLYAGDPDAVSLPAAFPFRAGLERDHRSMLVGAMRLAARRAPEPRLRSFATGMQDLVDALAAGLGPRVRKGAEVDAIEPARGGGFLVHVRGDRGPLRAPAVALATPAPTVARLLADLAPEAAVAARGVPYVPVTLIYLGYAAAALPRPLDAYGFLVSPGERTRLVGAVFSSACFAGRAPDGHALISARIGGARGRALAARPDDELIALAHEDLRPLLGLRAAPTFTRVLRHAEALPQYVLGHHARVAAIEAAERAHPGLHFTGAAWRGAGVPDCLRDGAATAARIARATEARGEKRGILPVCRPAES